MTCSFINLFICSYLSQSPQCTDQFMKIVGLRYLHDTVKPVIDDIFKEQLNCEIDPSKVHASLTYLCSLSLLFFLSFLFLHLISTTSQLPEKKNVDDIVQKNLANLKK